MIIIIFVLLPFIFYCSLYHIDDRSSRYIRERPFFPCDRSVCWNQRDDHQDIFICRNVHIYIYGYQVHCLFEPVWKEMGKELQKRMVASLLFIYVNLTYTSNYLQLHKIILPFHGTCPLCWPSGSTRGNDTMYSKWYDNLSSSSSLSNGLKKTQWTMMMFHNNIASHIIVLNSESTASLTLQNFCLVFNTRFSATYRLW